MYIFGGILELTKELNELLCCQFTNDNCEFQLMNSGFVPEDEEWNEHGSNGRAQEDMSPGMKSPSKYARNNNFGSPSKTNKSPSKTTTKGRHGGKSPSKKDNQAASKQESGLVSPTSISMQNSFIIKNADESFDAYYAQMRKRKMGGG